MSVMRRSATICTGCWQVVAIDGENNRERIGALCSHLAPMVEVVPSTDTPGALERIGALARDEHVGAIHALQNIARLVDEALASPPGEGQ
jgi:hypothetical protein